MIKTIEDLRTELAESIERLKKDPRYCPQAVEINNAAGKMIQSAKVQIDYHALRKEQPEIAFLFGAKVKPKGA